MAASRPRPIPGGHPGPAGTGCRGRDPRDDRTGLPGLCAASAAPAARCADPARRARLASQGRGIPARDQRRVCRQRPPTSTSHDAHAATGRPHGLGADGRAQPAGTCLGQALHGGHRPHRRRRSQGAVPRGAAFRDAAGAGPLDRARCLRPVLGGRRVRVTGVRRVPHPCHEREPPASGGQLRTPAWRQPFPAVRYRRADHPRRPHHGCDRVRRRRAATVRSAPDPRRGRIMPPTHHAGAVARPIPGAGYVTAAEAGMDVDGGNQ